LVRVAFDRGESCLQNVKEAYDIFWVPSETYGQQQNTPPTSAIAVKGFQSHL
jgi:hypothetical protein